MIVYGPINNLMSTFLPFAKHCTNMDSPFMVSATMLQLLGSWSESATILTVYTSLALSVMVCSEILVPLTVTLPVSAPPLVDS